MRRFQMMYMMPRRRALAYFLPRPSFFSNQFSSAVARAASARSWADTAQSHARPSLCSLRPRTAQSLVMPRLPVVGYVRRTSRAKAITPGFATGSHETCGRYGDNFSIFFGSATGAVGTGTWAAARRATGAASTSARRVDPALTTAISPSQAGTQQLDHLAVAAPGARRQPWLLII